jgi:hypothetical protein
MSEALAAKGQALRGIRVLGLAIRLLQADPRQLTSIHSILLESCLTSSNLKAALPFLIDDVEDFSSEVCAVAGSYARKERIILIVDSNSTLFICIFCILLK